MGLLARTSFAQGWMPDADAVSAPANALLRADNVVLDELGTVALRPGSVAINSTAWADTDVHSLYTTLLNGTRYRMAGAGSALYINGTKQTGTIAGTGDLSFGSTQGHIFWGRSTTKGSYDGTTVRTWGLTMSGGAPTAQGNSSPQTLTLSTCASGESPAWTALRTEAVAYVTGQDGTANGAVSITAETSGTGRAMVQRSFTVDQDFLHYANGTEGTDEDTFSLWVYVPDGTTLLSLALYVDVNDIYASSGAFADYYLYTWGKEYTSGGVSTPLVSVANWVQLSIKRKDFVRYGTTSGKDWSTVCSIRVTSSTDISLTTTPGVFYLDALTLALGGISGAYTYKYVYVREATSYTALSAPSAASAELLTDGIPVTVHIPADASRTTEITAIWVYRFGEGIEDDYVRVATVAVADLENTPFSTTAAWEMATVDQDLALAWGCSNYTGADEPIVDPSFTWYGSSNHTCDDEAEDEDGTDWLTDCGAAIDLSMVTGGITATDILSDDDALTLNIPIEPYVTTPPNSIVGMAGPYYDRLFCLTATTLYPSCRLNPESFKTTQAITVGNPEETAYWVIQALGGLYVGTSRDIYRIDGTFAELPDGTIEATKVPLSVDHPPVSAAVTKDGPLVVYLAHDGWRALSGTASTLLVGATSLLYKGYTRHGVSPVNLSTGRLRVTITKGQLVAITPEGTSTTSSTVLYRYAFGLQRWYRHLYTPSFRSITREPDGTLIAGDTTGQVWTLDTGTQDGTTDIPVELWTRAEDDGKPFSPKSAADLQISLDSGGDTLAVAVHTDGSSTAALASSVSSTGRGTDNIAIDGVAQFKQIQLRATGSFSTFYFTGFAVTYTEVPMGVTTWDSGPLDLGTRDLIWIRHVIIKARAAAALTVTCYFDGVAWPAVVADSRGPVWNVPTIHDATLGRNSQGAYKGYVPRIIVTSTAPFFPFFVELIARATSAETEKKTFRFSAHVGGETYA
jgi:hypothetical protein